MILVKDLFQLFCTLVEAVVTLKIFDADYFSTEEYEDYD